jgi:hypothetical protein
MKRLAVVLLLVVWTGCRLGGDVVAPPPDDGIGHEPARALLVGNAPETPGFGLYSYVLFGVRPTAATRPRYLRTIAAWLESVDSVAAMRTQFSPAELDVTYLPVLAEPPADVAGGAGEAAWLLERYNYPRARALLDRLGGARRQGPYLVSYGRPLSGLREEPRRYLVQDLSTAHPDVADLWVRTFLARASRPRYWEPAAGEQIALEMRNALAHVKDGLPAVREALVVWVR